MDGCENSSFSRLGVDMETRNFEFCIWAKIGFLYEDNMWFELFDGTNDI